MRRRQVVLTALILVALTACTPESKDVTVTIDTTDWQRFCLGYHTVQVPPGFDLGQHSATVDDQALSVVSDDPSALADIIARQEDFGRVLDRVRVQDWDVVVATMNNGLVESQFSLMVVGAQRVGRDVVVTKSEIGREDYPAGGDPALWAWHQRTSLRPLSQGPADTGYCLGGIVFDSPQLPEPRATFLTSFAVRGPDTARGAPTFRSDATLTLQSMYIPPEQMDDARPLAAGPDVATFPGVSVAAEQLRIAGRDYGFTTVTHEQGGKRTLWYDAASFSETAGDRFPTILAMKFRNQTQDDATSREQALAILASLRLGH